MKVEHSRKYLAGLIICALSVIIYRCVLFKEYLTLYVDGDQATMWYGTAMAAHFKLAEPHFLAQAYGSMIESIVAVPLYWVGVPFNYSMPIATFLLWFSPFILLAIYSFKKNMYCAAYVCMLLPNCFAWDYDILTNIPRSFVGGYIFCFIAILFIERNSSLSMFLAVIFFSLAYICTETTITITLLCLLHYGLYHFNELKHINWTLPIFGGVIGLVMIWFCNIEFYALHPDYNLHDGMPTGISYSALKSNMMNLGSLSRSYSAVSIHGIPALLIVALVGYFIICLAFRMWKNIILGICALGGTMSFMILERTADYLDGLLFSQCRIFIFFPYVLLILIFYLAVDFSEKNNISEANIKRILFTALFFSILLSAFKILYFERIALRSDELYNNELLGVAKVEEVYTAAEQILKRVNETGADTVVFQSDDKPLGYGTSAINYGLYTGYIAFYDRRTATYLELQNPKYSGKILLVQTEDNSITQIDEVQIDDMSIIDWVTINLGIVRK